jgi:chromosome segregation ATPase
MVDGVDMSTRPNLRDYLAAPKEEIEPFDFELNDRLRQLYARVDDLTLEIARLRKRVPAESTRLYQHALERRRELEQQAASESDVDAEEDAVDADTDARLQQLRDIKHTYYGAIGGLDELISTMPETKTQLEQLEQTLQFIQNEQDPALSKPQ